MHSRLDGHGFGLPSSYDVDQWLQAIDAFSQDLQVVKAAPSLSLISQKIWQHFAIREFVPL